MLKAYNLSNRRFFELQRMQNDHSYKKKARVDPYSNYAQVFKPLSALLYTRQLELDKYFSNLIPSTIDPTDIGMSFICNAININSSSTLFGLVNSTSSVVVQQVRNELNDYWYDALPTRVEFIATDTKQTHKIFYGSDIQKAYDGNSYVDNLGQLTNLINVNSTYFFSTSTNGTSGTNVDSYWGSLPSYLKTATDTVTNHLGFLGTSGTSSSVLEINFMYQILDTNIQSIEFEYGISGVSTSTATDTNISTSWKPFQRYINDSTSTDNSTGFLDLNIVSTNTSTGYLINIKDIKMYDWAQEIESTTFSNAGSLINFFNYGTSLYPAVVSISDGVGIGNPDYRKSDGVGGIVVTGLNQLSQVDQEFISTPFNGVHKGNKLFNRLLKLEPRSINNEAMFSVQLHDFQNTSFIFDPTDLLTTIREDNLLFYTLTQESTGDAQDYYLNYNSFIFENPKLLGSGWDSLEVFEKVALRTEEGSDLTSITDAAYSIKEKILYILDSDESKIYMYDVYPHWPDKQAIEALKLRTSDCLHSIVNIDDRRYSLRGETRYFKGAYNNRFQYITKYRWLLQKPDLSVVGIDYTGSEVSATGDFWILNDGHYSGNIEEYLYKPIPIPVSFDQYGDYVLILETEFQEFDSLKYSLERDVHIVSVFKKNALGYVSYADAETPTGIDISPNEDLMLSYSVSENPYLLKTKTLRKRYDYFTIDELNNFVFRENYLNGVAIILNNLGENMCNSTIYGKTSSTTLVKGEAKDDSLVLGFTASGAVTLTLPILTSIENGHRFTIKRWGGNNLVISGNGGSLIDGSATYTLYSDKDAVTLIYYHATKTWMVV